MRWPLWIQQRAKGDFVKLQVDATIPGDHGAVQHMLPWACLPYILTLEQRDTSVVNDERSWFFMEDGPVRLTMYLLIINVAKRRNDEQAWYKNRMAGRWLTQWFCLLEDILRYLVVKMLNEAAREMRWSLQLSVHLEALYGTEVSPMLISTLDVLLRLPDYL